MTTEATTRVDADRLRAFCASVYERAGVPAEDALLAADALVQADLWGHQSHGVLRLGWYYARLRNQAMNAVTRTEIALDSGAVAVLEGNDGVGPVVAQQACEEAVRRAKQHGLGAVSVRNSNHFGTCMYFTRQAAAQGCVMLLTSNAGPNMAPWGGLRKMIGTNPWSIAAPAGKYGSLVMDMANSGVARGKIYLANNRRESIPDHWAIDAEGRPTTDPQKALEGFILPMAGHKGYVMGVMVDVLSGVLSGSQYLDTVHGPYDPVNKSGAGHLFLAMNVEAFQPIAEFNRRAEDYIERLTGVPLAAGHKKVYFPGELENENDAANRANGIELPEDTVADLRRVASEVGIDTLPF